VSAAAPNILVVEDESSIASFVSLYLKNAGYGVRTAANGTDALAQVAQEMPGLIVLDLMLPDIDGIEVTKRIRQTSDVPILMLTARDEDVDKIIGLEVGADRQVRRGRDSADGFDHQVYGDVLAVFVAVGSGDRVAGRGERLGAVEVGDDLGADHIPHVYDFEQRGGGVELE